jgi:hypothetical protein
LSRKRHLLLALSSAVFLYNIPCRNVG